ncbi:hypothetical protein AB0N05_27765 [Nocardia sp. NPDC051030]|uniref:hypothetical protein n=1 Tax=Nocardia sp. NPDC051030 TaxID=3155162 RepID=UPI003441AFB3
MMVGEPVTTLHDYQLAMLHPMNKSAPAQAAKLLDSVGATSADTAAAEKRWFYGEAVNAFKSIDEYVTAWGAPTSERSEPLGSREIRYARWDLTFWPGLQIEFMELHRGYNLFRQLRRNPEMPRPQIDSVADLTPWSCTCAELQESSLGPVDFVDGFGAVGDVFVFTAVHPGTGRQQQYFAYIDWGLLQGVEPAPVQPPDDVLVGGVPVQPITRSGSSHVGILSDSPD